MRRARTVKIVCLLLLSQILFVFAGCSQMSLFNLVKSEQEGEFSLGVESINLKAGSEFNFNSVGGYLPYTYTVNEGSGAIDPETGAYTAPGTVGEATVESTDGLGHRDSASVVIYDYESIMADPATFGIHAGATTPQDITLTGGVGSLTASAELGVIDPPIFVSEGEFTTSYSPPDDPGTDYIEIVDEQENTLTIMVEVLPAAGDVVLEILPTYAVLLPNEKVDFTITNNTLNSVSIILSDSLGTIDDTPVSSGATVTREYTAPSTEGAEFLTITEDAPMGDSVQADIYVQGEVTPLEITPGTVEVSPGTTVEFTASGGFPPYEFSQLNGTGTLVQTSPTTANYTPESVISMIRVTDGVGSQAKVKIQVK
ncbi:MAG: hypothetical protein K9M94_11960 [Spirochaetia bacterium]|nr:hypothetical protein [Spirochaetia bacterium]